MKLKRMEILNQPENLSEIDSDFFYKVLYYYFINYKTKI